MRVEGEETVEEMLQYGKLCERVIYIFSFALFFYLFGRSTISYRCFSSSISLGDLLCGQGLDFLLGNDDDAVEC